jgi:hypothetical protein
MLPASFVRCPVHRLADCNRPDEEIQIDQRTGEEMFARAGDVKCAISRLMDVTIGLHPLEGKQLAAYLGGR